MDVIRTYIKDLLKSEPGNRVTAQGWVKTKRDSKAVSFVQLSDGSTFTDLQVVVPSDCIAQEGLKEVTIGACVAFTGELVKSPAKEQLVELRAESFKLFGASDPKEYPLQKKGASFEFLREVAHLRVRGNTLGAVFRVRSRLSWAIHQFFQSRGFHNIQTPIITASDCEGAGTLFSVSTLLQEKNGTLSLCSEQSSNDFFGKPTFLTVSGQLEAETLAHGLTNVYTFGPTFRAENSHSARHLAEFWMIEPEMAFCDLEGDMNFAEEFLKEVIANVMEACPEDIEFFNQRIEPTLKETLYHVIRSPFEKLSYTEAIKMLESSGETFEFPIHWGCDLQSEHERWLAEKKIGRPIILYDFPKEIKAFYMRSNDDEKTVAAMDVLVPKIGEIIGGSQREERFDLLRSRILGSGLPEEAYTWYLDLRRFGSVPHSGFGLGLERLLMYITGMKNIRDVIPYYRAPGSAKF